MTCLVSCIPSPQQHRRTDGATDTEGAGRPKSRGESVVQLSPLLGEGGDVVVTAGDLLGAVGGAQLSRKCGEKALGFGLQVEAAFPVGGGS